MKQFLTLVLMLGFSTQVLAESRLAQEVKNVSDRVNHRLHLDADQMSQYQLEQIANKYRDIQFIMQGRNPGNPPPRYGNRMEVKKVILKAMQAVSNDSSKAKIGQKGIQIVDDSSLNGLLQSCLKSSYYSERARCMESGLAGMRGSIFLQFEEMRNTIHQMCMQSSYYSERVNCYEASIEASQSDDLYNRTIGCRAMSSVSSKSQCYQQALQ